MIARMLKVATNAALKGMLLSIGRHIHGSETLPRTQQSKSTHMNRVDIATNIEGTVIHVNIIEGNDTYICNCFPFRSRFVV